MPSKMVLDREKRAAAVANAARQHAAKMSVALATRFAPVLAAEQPLPDFDNLQQALGQLVAAERQQLVSRDETHVTELDHDREVRAARDTAAAEVYEKLFEVRDTFEGQFGAGASAKVLGGETRIPTDPLALHRLGSRVLERLLSPQLVLPPARLNGVSVDPPALATSFDLPLHRLGEALETLGRERKDSDDTVLEKAAALERTDRTVAAAARVLDGLYALAGYPGWAEKVRLTRRAPRRAQEEDPGDVDVDVDVEVPAPEPLAGDGAEAAPS